jgi:guanylate kinase
MGKWKLIFILGVSGAGKHTIIQELLNSDMLLTEVISCKTRPLRPNEVNHVDFHYMTEEEFQIAITQWVFLEYERHYNLPYLYGTRREDITKGLGEWRNLLKEIDIKWLISVAQTDPDIFQNSLRVFIDLPELTMIDRITKRAPIPELDLRNRILTATWEREDAKKYCTHIVCGEWTREEVYERIYKVVQDFIKDPH